MEGAASPAAMLQQIQAQQAQLARVLSDLHDIGHNGNTILRTIALENAAPVLDLLQQAGMADANFFAVAQSIAAGVTVQSVVNVLPGRGQVGFWRFLTVEPDTSRVFSMTMNIDGSPRFTNPSVVPGDLFPQSLWLPYYASFSVDFTNLDGIAAHVINVVGLRVFLRTDVWQRIKAIMDQGLGLICNQELCQGEL